MDTDERPDLRVGGESKLILRAETEKIIGFSFEVLNEVGHGLNEKIYENSLTVLFKRNGIAFDQQRRFSVLFRGEVVGEFAPDLIVFGSVIVDTKVIDRITDHERGQMLNYLRIAKLRVGLIVNFKKAKLEFERVVL
ncbi:MAG TPA: GxxExxY protein [Candidatus Acidoferrales bacterium]|jgi:GxxExxY protein|nr:GxxExxY protein [Candidatus Acidoferrales bacterium]